MSAASLLEAAMERARPVADAVMREGQVLFPYRASALKNRYRWQWGVLAPPAWPGATGSDRPGRSIECVADVRAGASVAVRVRFVQLQVRGAAHPGATAHGAGAAGAGPLLDEWDEAIERAVDVGPLPVPTAEHQQVVTEARVAFDGAEIASPPDGHGGEAVRRSRHPLEGAVRLDLQRLPGPWSLVRARVEVENRTPWGGGAAGRADALRSSLVAVHAVLGVERGAFLSNVDPPEFARPAVDAGRGDGLWLALVGTAGDAGVALATPIILPDHPAVATASPGDTCDATEIDELLTLSVAALGADEQAEARATDPVAAAIIDRATRQGAPHLAALHASAPAVQATARLDAEDLTPGSRVRLCPAPGADAQDLFLDGSVGVVEAVLQDADGCTHVAVTIEGDPGADLHRAQGRYRYFRLEELEPLAERAVADRARGPGQVVVAGAGNVWLSDDGFGVAVARRLAEEALPPHVRLVDAGIRGVHLAYDLLDGCETLVLVDAMQRGDPPGTLTVLDATDGALPVVEQVDGHALDPAAVLALVERLGGRRPRTFVVACEPATLEEGVGLSPDVEAAIEPAAELVLEVLGASRRA